MIPICYLLSRELGPSWPPAATDWFISAFLLLLSTTCEIAPQKTENKSSGKDLQTGCNLPGLQSKCLFIYEVCQPELLCIFSFYHLIKENAEKQKRILNNFLMYESSSTCQGRRGLRGTIFKIQMLWRNSFIFVVILIVMIML